MNISSQEKQKVVQQATDCLRTLGREDLFLYLRIDWSNKFTSRMGDALYARENEQVLKSNEKYRINGIIARVRFSIPLWPRATEEERKETVVHEICHLVAAHEAFLEKRKISNKHGYEWQSLMRKAGVEPEEKHRINVLGVGRKTIVAKCHCQEHSITPLVAGRIMNNPFYYYCTRCRWAITVDAQSLSQNQIEKCKQAVSKNIEKKMKFGLTKA